MDCFSFVLVTCSLLYFAQCGTTQTTENTTTPDILDNTTTTAALDSVNATVHITSATSDLELAECPGDVFGRVRACTRKVGILAAALHSIVSPSTPFAFCGLDQSVALTCLQDNLDLCHGNPMKRALLALHVDVETMQSDLQYVCQNRQVLNSEKNCTGYYEASRCSKRVAAKLKDTLTLTIELKPYLDAQCLYNDDLLQCLTATTGPECNGTRQLYKRLLHAMRYPYCDLPEVDQYASLHHALSLPENSSDTTRTGGEAGGSGNGAVSGKGMEEISFWRFVFIAGISLFHLL